MKAKETIKKPIVDEKKLVSRDDFAFEDDAYAELVLLKGFDFSEQEALDVSIQSSSLEDSNLSQSKLHGLKLVDVSVAKLNAAGADFEKAHFDRVGIENSRLTGVLIADAALRDVYIKSSKVDLSSFRFSKLQNVCFEKCLMAEADFTGAKLQSVRFLDCDLSKAIFSQATLSQIDASGSVIDGIVIAPEQLRGLTIDASQIFIVARLLGIVVK